MSTSRMTKEPSAQLATIYEDSIHQSTIGQKPVTDAMCVG